MTALAVPCSAQRVMDKLDRGLVAVSVNNGMFVSWRVLGEDSENVKFNLYRDGTLLNSQPLSVSNFTDNSGSATSQYVVKTVINGVEKEASKAAIVSHNDYLEIKIAAVPSNKDGKDISGVYEPNDATVADLDGDGQMEILLKLRNTVFHANGYPEESTDYDIIQVYKLDGTLMWWIDCGRNMVDFQSNEINIAAYDWDLDGKAECVLRAADGTVIHLADGTTQVIGDPTVDTLADARNNGMTEKFTHTGAEYLLYLNGETGKPYQVMEYPLKRLEAGESSLDAAWGDGYGHRSSKHFFGAPYLDGRKPSIFLARGIYTRHKMVAYDVDPATHELIERWRWINNRAGSPWYGQGYHNYSIGDVDWDGRDEIVFGSMVIDDNGKGLSTTGLGHGDSQHLGDFNPYIYGQEFVACNEDNPNNNYRDATTSKIYYRTTATSDDGRAIAGNFSNEYPGAQFITSHDSKSLISTVINAHLDGASPTGDVAQNFRIFWDGDLLDETFNYQNGRNTAGTIYKFRKGAIRVFEGTATNNDTKGTPCFQGDILGDWREEIIMRAADNKSIRIYTTTIPTDYRIYTLLHDPQYRNAMVWQMNGYNQCPHPSFFLGELEGITQAPPAPTMNGREEVIAGGNIGAEVKGKSIVFAVTGDASATVTDGASPDIFIDNAPSWVQGHDDNDAIEYVYYTHTLNGGAFTGDMKLVKLGAGTLVLPAVKQQYKGVTEVWYGNLSFDGEMAESRVWLNRHTGLSTNGGKFSKGIEMDYGSKLEIGSDDKAASVTVSDLKLNFGSRICIDLFADGNSADQINATTLTIEKKDWKNGPKYSTPVIEFNAHLAAGESMLPAGDYVIGAIGSINGGIEDVVIEGLNGQKASLSYAEGKLVLKVDATRGASDIVWTGANGNVWDLGETENFKLNSNGEPTSFVTGDRVIFDDSATSTEINIPAGLYPSAIVFNNSEKDFTVNGSALEGNIAIEKKGTGRVVLNNTSTFRGSIQINNGVLEVASLGANEGEENGALGHYTNEIVLNGGGVLSIGVTGKMSHPIVSNDGGIEVINKGTVLTVTGSSISGNGTFVKSGAGQLNLASANKIGTLRIDQGIVYDEGDTHQLGKTIVFNGKNVELRHQDSRYSYSTDNAQYVVNENAKGKLTLDGRCSYTGRLTGSGDLEVYAPWIRNTIDGDWSDFAGTLTASQRQKSGGSDYGSSFDFNSAKGLDNATLYVNAGCTFNLTRLSAINVRAIGGTGVLGNENKTFTIVGDDEGCSFYGTFGKGVNVVKNSSGYLTISKEQTNMGVFEVNSGQLELNASSAAQKGSMTGSSPMTIRGELIGCGVCGNSIVTFLSGSILAPNNMAKSKTFRTISFLGDLVMENGSDYIAEIISTSKYGSIDVAGKMDIAGKVVVSLNGYTPALGDEFVLWKAGEASAVPALELPELPGGLAWDTSAVTPAEGVLKVAESSGVNGIEADEIVSCRVVTMAGVVVKEFTARAADAVAECEDLSNGVYVLTMSADGKTENRKVVID